jgi:hypothetical protein
MTRQPFDMPAPSSTTSSRSIKGQLEILDFSGKDQDDFSSVDWCPLVEALKHPESSLGISSLQELVCEIDLRVEASIRMMSMIAQEAARSLEGWSILQSYSCMLHLHRNCTG